MKKFHFFSILLLMLALVPQVARAEYYGIKVAGVSVTSDNCDNITGENIWSYGYSRTKEFVPEASHVSYDPSTKTLTLKYIQIERTGSNNRAILNESCDGLTIVFEDTNYLSALAASPIRLNANTTIKCASGRYGDFQKIYGGVEDAITVGNGATLLIEDISISVSTNRVESESGVFVGNTGTERLIIKDAAVWAQGMHGVKDFAMLGVQNGHLWLKGDNAAAKNLKDFSMVGKTMYLTDTFYNDGTLNFLNSSDYSVAREVTITDYVEINETNFPDDIFRSYVSEEFDKDNDGRLTYQGEANSNYFNNIIDVSNKGLTSLKGIEHFPYLETLKCANNNLTSLDVSKLSQLRELECYCNQLTSLNVTKEKEYYGLQKLVCYQNKLTRLDIPQGVHDKLDCSYNLLTYIDFSNCSYWTNKIYIDHNRIDAFMTETLESLPDVTEGTKSDGYSITISSGTTNDNVCTGEQADIARNKGWEVFVAGLDSDGNIVYNIEIGGTMITSANADDLTVLPNVTKNCVDGYARYEPATQKLHLSGVDIVNEEGDGINFNIKGLKPTIEIGLDPVNITAKGEGISYDSRNGSKNGLLTITSKEDYWYSEKLNVISTEDHAFYIQGNLILQGVARIEAKSLSNVCPFDLDETLYVKDDAELRIKSNGYYSLSANALVLEDDNIVVTHPEATIPEGSGSLRDAEGHTIRGEVVIGKLRNYNYYVAGTRITNANQHAVLGDTTVVFQEPAFLGGKGTIVLNNANIDGGSSAYGIEASKALDIKLIGENNVVTDTRYGIYASGSITIEGPGSLYTRGARYGINSGNKLNIGGDAKVTAEGGRYYGIAATNEATISGAGTVVKAKCSAEGSGAFKASALTLNDGITIDEPEGAQFVDGEIKDADGNVIKDEWVTILKINKYDLYVYEKQVTDKNKDDIFGDGTVSYDSETRTLTLNNANIKGIRAMNTAIDAKVTNLTINLIGENAIIDHHIGLALKDTGESSAVTFTGDGSLNINVSGTGITTWHDLVLRDAKLSVESGADYAAVQGHRTSDEAPLPSIYMSGNETELNAKGNSSIQDFHALHLSDCIKIKYPKGAKFVEDVGVVDRDNVLANRSWGWVRINNHYDIKIAGIQVMRSNWEDVFGDGTVSFDPETDTLTLNNVNIEAESNIGIYISEDIKIKLIGENFITSEDDAIMAESTNITIEGPGSLHLKSTYRPLYVRGDLFITGGTLVTAESAKVFAIHSRLLNVSGAETAVWMKGLLGAYTGDSIVLEDGLEIGMPIGAYFNSNTEDIVNAAGKVIKDEWVVIGSPEYITGINSLPAEEMVNGEWSNGKYFNLSGQRVGSNYKGIVIENGRKVLKK